MSQFGTSGGGGGGSIVTSITGNTGPAQTGDIHLITANSTPIFAGAAGTITLDFALTTNLLLGSSGSITSGQQNVAVGAFSQGSVTSGDTNSSLGVFSLLQLKTGFDNLALGNRAGFNLSTNESRNILLANDGVATESNAIRIGTRPYQTTAYIAGIDGVDLSTATIVTESADQLGTAVLTAGTGITITPGAGIITIDSSGGAGITTLVADDGASSSGAVINLIGFDGIHTQSNAAANFNFILRAPGTRNLYLGEGAGITGTSAGANICLGAFSMTSISGGSENIICGDSAAQALVSGAGNSSFGCVSMPSVVSGNYNTNLGFEAGFNNTGSDSSNINIGYTANGSAGVSNRLMIGGGTGAADGQLSSAFISGIDGVNVGSVATVVTESGNQLGTAVLTAGSGITITPGANTITIDATGGISPVAFFATLTATSNNVTGAGTDYVIAFDTVEFNVGGGFSVDTFTAPVDGKYSFTYSFWMQGTDPAMISGFTQLRTSAGIFQNEDFNPYLQGFSANNWFQGSYTNIVELTAGQTAKCAIRVFFGASDSIDLLGITDSGGYATSFSGYLLGPIGGSGSVAGPVSSTDRAISTWDGTSGSVLFDNPGVTISSSGYLQNSTQPAFGAYLNTSLSNVTGDGTQYFPIIFDATFFNQTGSYNTGTGIFTVPVSGVYHFQSTITLTGVGPAHTSANFLIHGLGLDTTFEIANPYALNSFSGLTSLSGSVTAYFTAGTSVFMDISVYSGALTVGISGADGGQYFSQFSGYLVC